MGVERTCFAPAWIRTAYGTPVSPLPGSATAYVFLLFFFLTAVESQISELWNSWNNKIIFSGINLLSMY